MKRTSDLRSKVLYEARFTFCRNAACPRAILHIVKGAHFAASPLKLAVSVLNCIHNKFNFSKPLIFHWRMRWLYFPRKQTSPCTQHFLAEIVKFPEPYWKAHCVLQNVLTSLVASSLKYVRDIFSSFEKKSCYSSSIIGSDISWDSQGVSVSRKPDSKRLVISHKEGQICSPCTGAALRELTGEALCSELGLEKQKHTQSWMWQGVQRVTRRIITDLAAAKGT